MTAADPTLANPPAFAHSFTGSPLGPNTLKSIGTSANEGGRNPPVGPEGQIAFSLALPTIPPAISISSLYVVPMHTSNTPGLRTCPPMPTHFNPWQPRCPCSMNHCGPLLMIAGT